MLSPLGPDRSAEGFVAASEDDERALELKKLGHLVGRPVDAEDVWTVLTDVVGVFDVAKVLDPQEVRVASVQVSQRREFTADASDFLNSFIATDLASVSSAVEARAYGPALRAYLGGGRAGDRVDVRAEPTLGHALAGRHRPLCGAGHRVAEHPRHCPSPATPPTSSPTSRNATSRPWTG